MFMLRVEKNKQWLVKFNNICFDNAIHLLAVDRTSDPTPYQKANKYISQKVKTIH